METEEKGGIASALARQAAAEDEGALKVIVAPDGTLAGMVFVRRLRCSASPAARFPSGRLSAGGR
jgi:hypothetical protein